MATNKNRKAKPRRDDKFMCYCQVCESHFPAEHDGFNLCGECLDNIKNPSAELLSNVMVNTVVAELEKRLSLTLSGNKHYVQATLQFNLTGAKSVTIDSNTLYLSE